MDSKSQRNQQSLHSSVQPEQAMEVPGNRGLGHMTLQHNHVNDSEHGSGGGGGGKAVDQAAYFAMATGHHGNMYHGNPQSQQAQHPQQSPGGMKGGFAGGMDGTVQYNQVMGSPPGASGNIHGSTVSGMPDSMAMYKSQQQQQQQQAMMGLGNPAVMGMGRGYRAGMNQYMMQHGMQHPVGGMNVTNRSVGAGGMIPGGPGLMQQQQQQGMLPHMMPGGGQAGMVNVRGHYVAQQYVDMSQGGHSHHQAHHGPRHQQQHHQYLGSPPNPCMMSPPLPQQQMQHTSPTMAQHGYSPSMKSYRSNMVSMETNSQQLQQSHQLQAHVQQQQQQQQQHITSHAHYQQQQHSMATVNLNQMNHPMSAASTKQLPDFRTLAGNSTSGGAVVSPSSLSGGVASFGYHKAGIMGMPCDDGDSSGAGSNPNSMGLAVGGVDKGAVDLSLGQGPPPHGSLHGVAHSFSASNLKQQYGTSGVDMAHVNNTFSQGNLQQNQQMLHHLRTMQSSGVTLNVTSSSVVTQTASAVSPAVTTTHVAPVVSHSALQNPVLTSRLKSGPAVQNAALAEMSSSLCPPPQPSLRNPHHPSVPSPTIPSPLSSSSTSPMPPASLAVTKHLCSTTTSSVAGCSSSQASYSSSSSIPSSLATFCNSQSSLASSAPAISALLSAGTRLQTNQYDQSSSSSSSSCSSSSSSSSSISPASTSKKLSYPNNTSPSCHTDNRHLHHHHHHHHHNRHLEAHGNEPQGHAPSTESEKLPPGGRTLNVSEKCTQQGVSTTSTCVVTVTVPFGWRRVVEAGAVAYYSASSVRLTSLSHTTKYLQTDGTCKCGLECPLLIEKVFNFDPQVASKQWNSNEISFDDDLTKLCNHKRKILAMATFHKSAVQRDGRPAVQRDGRPAVQRDGRPAVQRDGRPAVQRDGRPAVQRDGRPALLADVVEAATGDGDDVPRNKLVNSTNDSLYERMLVAQPPREHLKGCVNDSSTEYNRPPSENDHQHNSLVPKQEPGQAPNDKYHAQLDCRENSVNEHSADGHLNRVIKEEKCENSELRPDDSGSNCFNNRRVIDRKPDLKVMAQKVQAALRNQDRAGGCTFTTPGWNRQRPRAQSDRCSPTVPHENDLHNNIQRSMSNSSPNHQHPYEKHPHAYPHNSRIPPYRMTEHELGPTSKSQPDLFNNQTGGHGRNRYLPMDVHMALSAKTALGHHHTKHAMGNPSFPSETPSDEQYHHIVGQNEVNLQLPGLPTMENWAEMQKLGRRKPILKRNNKRKINNIIDRSSPCPNVDVRHMQQDKHNRDIMSGVPSFFENPSTFLAHQSALVANSLGKTEMPTDGIGEHAGSASSQLSPSPSISSLSTKSATPTGKLTPMSSPGRPCSQTSPACSSTSSTPKSSALSAAGLSVGYPGASFKSASTHLSPRQIQQMELQKQLHLMTSGSSFPRGLDIMDPVTATLSAGKEKVPKDEGRGSPQITSLNLHTVLNPRSSSSFPASSLLSAAARAQGGPKQQPALPAERASASTSPATCQKMPLQHSQFREFGLSSSQTQENVRHHVSPEEPEPPYHMQQHPQHPHHQHSKEHHHPHHHPSQHQQMGMMNNIPGNLAYISELPNNKNPAIYSQLSPSDAEPMHPRAAPMMSPAGHPIHSSFPQHMNPNFMNMNQQQQHHHQQHPHSLPRRTPPAQREVHHRGATLKEQTPIEKVQDMISGLEAAQNAIVAAHAAATAQEAMGKNPDGTWPAKRRKSTSSDGSVLSRHSTSRCSNGGSDLPLTPGMEQMISEGFRGLPPQQPPIADGMPLQNHLYGNLALSNSVDGTMDPNGPAVGAIINPNALAGTPQGLHNAGVLPTVNMVNVASAIPSTPTRQVTSVAALQDTQQLNSPQLMSIIERVTTAQQEDSAMQASNVKDGLKCGQSLPLEYLTPVVKKKTSPVISLPTMTSSELQKNQEAEDEEDTASVDHQLQPAEEHKQQEELHSDDGETPPKLKHVESKAEIGGLIPDDNDSVYVKSSVPIKVSVPDNHVHAASLHVAVDTTPPALLTSPQTTWTPPEAKVKRKRERTRKSSIPTIATMLQAAQNPPNQVSPVVMLPNIQTPLLQVVNPMLSQMISNIPEGGGGMSQQQQLMYLSLAMQHPHMNAQMLQNQDLSAYAMAASQAQVNVGQNQSGQQVSQVQGQSDMTLLQNQLNMIQSLNMLPALGTLNPALLQTLQSIPNSGVLGLQNMCALQPQTQQQLLRQVAPLLLQNQQLLQQLMQQQGLAVRGEDMIARTLAVQQEALQQEHQEQSQKEPEWSETLKDNRLDEDEAGHVSTVNDGQDMDSKALQSPEATLSASETPSMSDDLSEKKLSPNVVSPTKFPLNQQTGLLRLNVKQLLTSNTELDHKPSSPAGTSIPNPANLTNAVTAVVRSEDVFGDDENDHIEPPLRKYAVRKPRNHIKRITNCHSLTNNKLALTESPQSSPLKKSPVIKALTFETSVTPEDHVTAEESSVEQEEESLLAEEPSENDVLPEHHVSMNSIGTNTDEDGCLDASAEDMDGTCQSDEGIILGSNMASTATMTDEEPLNELDEMTDDDDTMDATVEDEMVEDDDTENNMSDDIVSDEDDDIMVYAEEEEEDEDEDTCPSGLEQTDETNTDEANTIEDPDEPTSIRYTEEEGFIEQGEPEPDRDSSEKVFDEVEDAEDKCSLAGTEPTDNETADNHVLQDGAVMTDGESDDVQSEFAVQSGIMVATAEKAQLPDEDAEQSLLDQSAQEDGDDQEQENAELDDDSADSSDEQPKLLYPRSFNTGDVVWGQIRGFPSWPGKLVDELAVKGNHKSVHGKMWVRWFGDHSFTQVEPEELKTLSEGLEAHHHARKKYRRGRKMNMSLESAIQEAMLELDRQELRRHESVKQSPGPTVASTSAKPEKCSEQLAPSVQPSPGSLSSPPVLSAASPGVVTASSSTLGFTTPPNSASATSFVRNNKSRPPKKRKR